MVKIRLRRIGSKGRPFYRIVVAKSTAGRNGAFVENIGTYDPIVKPAVIKIDEDRALHWLMTGAQPTETTAYILNKIGVLPRYFEARPNAKKDYSFLDKRTAAISVKASVKPEAEAKAEKAEAKAAEPAPAEPTLAETAPEAVEATSLIEVGEQLLEDATEPAVEAMAEASEIPEISEPSTPSAETETETPE